MGGERAGAGGIVEFHGLFLPLYYWLYETGLTKCICMK